MSKSLSDTTDEELLDELDRRRKARHAVPAPYPLGMPDWSAVRDMCLDYVFQLDQQGAVDDDLQHYIFEAALEAVFGKDVWQFVNNRLGAA